MRPKQPPAPQRPGQMALEGEEEELPAACTAFPPGQCSTTLRGLPWVHGSSSGEKKDQGGHPMPTALWVTAWGPQLQDYPTGTARGLYRAWLLGMGMWWSRGRGFQQLACASWKQSAACTTQIIIPASSFAHFQRQKGGTVCPKKVVRAQVCLLGALKCRAFPGLQPGMLPLPPKHWAKS